MAATRFIIHLINYTEVFYNRTDRHSHVGGLSPRPSKRPLREGLKCLVTGGSSLRLDAQDQVVNFLLSSSFIAFRNGDPVRTWQEFDRRT